MKMILASQCVFNSNYIPCVNQNISEKKIILEQTKHNHEYAVPHNKKNIKLKQWGPTFNKNFIFKMCSIFFCYEWLTKMYIYIKKQLKLMGQ